MLKESILEGAIDLHIHAGPSIAKRSVDAAESLQEAIEAGYRAVVIKDHYFPTMMGCTMVEKHLGNHRTNCFGGICLNNSAGGLNLNALDAAVTLGAKIVWMPTVSAKNHHDTHKSGFVGGGSLSVPDAPIYYLDPNGNLTPDAIAVLKFMASHPEVILATGHGSAREIDALIQEAHSLGVKKILVNHPYLDIGATIEQCQQWVQLGATIELTRSCFKPIINRKTNKEIGMIEFRVFKEYFDALPIESLVLDSDLGQSIFGSPVTEMYNFLNLIHEHFKITEEQIDIMFKKNPAKLLDLD